MEQEKASWEIHINVLLQKVGFHGQKEAGKSDALDKMNYMKTVKSLLLAHQENLLVLSSPFSFLKDTMKSVANVVYNKVVMFTCRLKLVLFFNK